MSDELETPAGTASADAAGTGDGGTAEGAAGSEEGAEKKVTITSHEYVTLKEAREQQKALADENARLKAEREARGTPPTPSGGEAEDARKQVEARQDYIARLEVEAKGGNEAAAALVSIHRSALESEQRTMYRLEMFEIPEGERDEIRKFMAQEGLRSPALARQFLRGGKFDDVAKDNARLRAEIEALKKNRPTIEGTRIVGDAPVTGRKKESGVEELTPAEYAKRMSDPKTVTATIAARRAGRLTIKR